jgi:hypothetical protein
MRLWHFLFVVAFVAMVLAIARDPIGRVALVVFFTAIGVMILATSSIMLMFRAVSALGSADSLGSYAEAIVATAGVVFFGTSSMLFVLWCGMGMIQKVVGW